MKRIAVAVLAMTLVGTAAWADLGAKLYLSGSFADQTGEGLILNNQDQQYNSPGMVRFSADGKAAGFGFNLYTGTLSDASAVKLQKVSAWFKPLPTLKVSLGGVGLYTYTEQINWWKAPNGAPLASAGFDNNVGSDSSAAVAAEWTGLPNLTLSAIAAPGYGTAWGANEGANAKGGAAVRYNVKAFGSVAAAVRYDGWRAPAFVHAGFDLNTIPNLYTFVDAVLRNDNTGLPGLDAAAVDWFAKYTVKQLTLQAAVPVTFRLTGLAGDESYLSYDLKASYDLPAWKVTPFVQVQQDHLSLTSLEALPQVNVGTSLNGLGNATFETSFQYKVVAGADEWSIPFALNVWY